MRLDYTVQAQQAYQQLKTYFKGSTNYWQLGNAFDTATDYLAMAWNTYPDPEMAKLALRAYQTTSGCWYDDYGWWGIAGSKAYESAFAPVFGPYADTFQTIAGDCWNVMNIGKGDGVHLGAPNAWTNIDNRSRFVPPPPTVPPGYWDAMRPRFGNGVGSGVQGVWQYDLFYNRRVAPQWIGPAECNGMTNPSDPSLPAVWGGAYQLTVVNGLFLVLGMRLALQGLGNTIGAVKDELGFLRGWFGFDPNNPVDAGHALLKSMGGQSVLIRERVGTYAFYQGGFPEVQNWDTETCWGGDQGLILGGLADYLRLNPSDSLLTHVTRSITSGVAGSMVDGGALAPWYPLQGNKLESWDYGDYKCGNGVFMRYLLRAAMQEHSPIAGIVGTPDFQQFLIHAAAAAANQPMDDLFDALNVLATLTTAMQLVR